MNMENLTTSSDGGTCQLLPSSKKSTISHKSLCLDDLDDDLLLEILLRLPTAKHALICTSVCKNWYRTILNRSFIARFVIHHMDSSDVNYNCNVATYDPGSSHEPLLLCKNPNFEIKRLDFSSLWEGSEWGSIVSSCNDLVLYMAMKDDGFRYFICNVLTMQNTALTVPADWLVKRGEQPPFHPDLECALICEPYCSGDAKLQTALNDGCRYRVLRFRRDRHYRIYGSPVEMYCSETPDKWDTVYFLHEGRLKVVESNLVAYRGKVHWSNGQHIVAYDPFSAVGCYVDDFSRLRFCDTSVGFCIPHPKTDATERWSRRRLVMSGLGICQSRLRFMEVGSFDKKGFILRVWDLKDYENKEWSVDRRVSLDRLGCKSKFVARKVLSSLLLLGRWSNISMRSMLAPHPMDEDVVYFILNDIIASCNMRTEELEVLAEFPRGLASAQCETSAQLLTIPWWPTRILRDLQQQ